MRKICVRENPFRQFCDYPQSIAASAPSSSSRTGFRCFAKKAASDVSQWRLALDQDRLACQPTNQTLSVTTVPRRLSSTQLNNFGLLLALWLDQLERRYCAWSLAADSEQPWQQLPNHCSSHCREYHQSDRFAAFGELRRSKRNRRWLEIAANRQCNQSKPARSSPAASLMHCSSLARSITRFAAWQATSWLRITNIKHERQQISLN